MKPKDSSIFDLNNSDNQLVLLDALTNCPGIGLFIVNREGLIEYCNEWSCLIFEGEKNAFLGSNLFDLIAPSEESWFKEDHQQLFEGGGTGEIDLEVISCKGKNLHLLFISKIIDTTSKKKLRVITIKDLTEKYRYLKLLETTNIISKSGGFEVDLRTRTVSWTLSTKMLHEVDLSYEPTIETAQDFIVPKFRAFAKEAYEKCIQNKTSFNIRLQIETTKKELKWIQIIGEPLYENGIPIKVAGSMTDISDKKVAEDRLQISERIFENSVDLICVMDFDGQLLEVNPAWEKCLGWNRAELLKNNWRKYVHLEDQEKFDQYTKKAVNGAKFQQFENRFSCKNGSFKWISWNIYSYENEKQIVGLGKDFTYKKEEENRLLLFEMMFMHIQDGILITDAKPNGQMPEILYVNDTLAKITGYPKQELIGKSPSLFSGPESDLSELIRLGDIIKKEIPGEFEILNYKKNGEKFWNRFSIVPIKNETGKCTNWVAIEVDITQKKIQTQKLIESETKFRSLVENSSIGIYILGSKGFIFVNKRFTQITGYTEHEIYSMPLKNWVHPDDFEMVSQKIEDRIKGKSLEANYEIRVFNNKGNLIEIEVHGNRTIYNGEPAVIGTMLDITERKKSEEKIRKFSQAIVQSGASVVVTDLEGNIEYVNPAFTKITGYTAEEAIGKNPRILKTEFTEEGTHTNLWDKLSNQQSWMGTFCNKKKNGELYWEHATISPIFDNNGVKTNYVAVKEDITNRILLEEEKEKLIAEVTLSYQELKKFSYIITHNLRAPLTNLIGILDLLDPSSISDETIRILLEGFKKSTLRLNETMQDLIKTLIIKENTDHKYTLVTFEDILEKVKKNFDHQIERENVLLETNFKDAPSGNFIPSYLESIFQNLLANSIKYAQIGIPPKILIESKKDNNKIILTFKDNGMGMDMNKVKDRLFGMYQKFHKFDDSKGIGLYLVKSHVHALRGTITAQSEINKGTIFTIIFEQ
ncbi:MAG: hypothetical protein CFE21_12245 [Bacteroidetes bacterium B1(2017)]|nr:MAG: hypothetical protein CFE21_12245 [Bacteroidetes bacterium B1(2017)]